jgi:hypothetical protein
LTSCGLVSALNTTNDGLSCCFNLVARQPWETLDINFLQSRVKLYFILYEYTPESNRRHFYTHIHVGGFSGNVCKIKAVLWRVLWLCFFATREWVYMLDKKRRKFLSPLTPIAHWQFGEPCQPANWLWPGYMGSFSSVQLHHDVILRCRSLAIFDLESWSRKNGSFEIRRDFKRLICNFCKKWSNKNKLLPNEFANYWNAQAV